MQAQPWCRRHLLCKCYMAAGELQMTIRAQFSSSRSTHDQWRPLKDHRDDNCHLRWRRLTLWSNSHQSNHYRTKSECRSISTTILVKSCPPRSNSQKLSLSLPKQNSTLGSQNTSAKSIDTWCTPCSSAHPMQRPDYKGTTRHTLPAKTLKMKKRKPTPCLLKIWTAFAKL